ncbi:MAG TPA: ABC transporter permease [Pseudolabrys sp.]|nr:ABC transporter permease [Pseudolabrys sp.]
MQRAQMQPDIHTRATIAETDDLPVIVRRTTFFERKLVRQVLPWAVIAGMFVLWELAVRIFQIPQFVLPAPTAIFEELWRWRVPILENSWQTLMTTLVGFAFAIVIGAIGGVALGSSRVIYDGFYPALIAFNSVPKVAVIPVLVIWFGIGTIPAVITAFLLSFFPILVNVATGIATVEPELRDVLRALGATKRQVIMKVGLPRAMPYFFASLKIAMTVAFVGSIVAETVAANAGIGHLMLVASSRFEVPLAFAGLIVTGLMGVGMYVICVAIEQRMTGWATRGSEGVTFGS